MEKDFSLPPELIGRFAVVKLWPGIKTAEDECIARLKAAATSLGLECIEIHSDGRILNDTEKTITKKDVDFVIHLHYDTPKLYDAFSFVALWNPIQFYHEWGYARTSRNLLTHDDFLSCSATPADDHAARLIRRSATHLSPSFHLYHSLADVVHSPSLGDCKLFYAGINWDALKGGVSRHQTLLKCLDKTGDLRIYGPKIFQGVRVWKGYDSYVREIPFDGISMIDEIAKAGIALVLSSQAHKDSELMSNRLFESVAAGALVICDENNFAAKFFGDSLLYIDSRCPVNEICDDIKNHLVWVKNNPAEALEMVERAQRIFSEKFTLNKNLRKLYLGLSNRKSELLRHQKPDNHPGISVCAYFMVPDFSEDILDSHLNSIRVQEYDDFSPVLVIDKTAYQENKVYIEESLATSPIPVEVKYIDFYSNGAIGKIKERRKVGAVLSDLLKSKPENDAVVFVAPNERILSNHLQVLAFSLMRNPQSNCAATASILINGKNPVHSVHEKIDFCQFNSLLQIGYARFIFRLSALPADLNLALPYIDRKTMAILIGDNVPVQEIPSTVIIDVTREFPDGAWDEGQENNLIASFCPGVFKVLEGCEISLPPLSIPASTKEIASGIIKRFSLNWIIAQIAAIRRQGLSARLDILKDKIRRRVSRAIKSMMY